MRKRAHRIGSRTSAPLDIQAVVVTAPETTFDSTIPLIGTRPPPGPSSHDCLGPISRYTMSIHMQSEPYTSRLESDNDAYRTPSIFDNQSTYYHNNPNPSSNPYSNSNSNTERNLYENQYSFADPNPNITSRETGTPIFGRYAQDGFWDDESDTTTIRQRASSSTQHTIMTKSPASSGHRAPSTKGGDYARSVTPGGGGSTHGPMPSPGFTPDQWSKEDDKADRGLFAWAKRPSVANLQAVMHGHPIDEHHNKDTSPPVPAKKKSFGMLRGMGKRGELTVSVDPADESVGT